MDSALKIALKDFLKREEKKLIAERDFLKAVRDSAGGGAGLETVSTDATSATLLTSLSTHFTDVT